MRISDWSSDVCSSDLIHNKAWRIPDPTRKTGAWKKIKPLGIKFRLLQLTLHRDDARTATEVERLDLPGIEMAPIASGMDPAAFYEGADRLWFQIGRAHV